MSANDYGAGPAFTRDRRDQPGCEPDASTRRPLTIRVEHSNLDSSGALPHDLLAVVRFDPGGAAPVQAPLCIDVQLPLLRGPATAELWRTAGAVSAGTCERIRYAHDESFLLASLEQDERDCGGIGPTAELAYTQVRRFQQQCGFPQVLRMWNYLDAINEGAGDLERYRQFCVGRARGFDHGSPSHPAATAIGRPRPTGRLQVLWLASRSPGTAMENPRQMSAYHYPRAHGPVSPTFSRATLAADGTLLVSGTASIVGHISRHQGDAREQLEEILRNLAALVTHARRRPATLADALLKVYVRDASLLEPIATRLGEHGLGSDVIFLAGDICRRELLVEIECIQRD